LNIRADSSRPQTVLLSYGHAAHLNSVLLYFLKVTGLPLPDIEWLINGRPVRQDALHKILVRENNVHSLLLERVSPMDEGQYTIKASNKAGTAVAYIQLHVTRKNSTLIFF